MNWIKKQIKWYSNKDFLRGVVSNLKKSVKYWHVLLFTLFPIVNFYLTNSEQLSVNEPEVRMFLLLGFVFMLVASGLSLLITRNSLKAAIVSSFFILGFFLYGHLEDGLKNFAIHEISFGSTKLIVLVYVGLFALIIFLMHKADAEKITKVNKNLTLIAGILVLIPIVQIIPKEIAQAKSNSALTHVKQTESADKLSSDRLPDVYYIVLDSYPRNDILKKHFGYDNSAFIKELEKRGFYIANNSNSNYAHTYLSLPSTLNMRYLDELPKQLGEDSKNNTASLVMIEDNKIVPAMQSLGYKFVNVGSGWFQTAKTENNDIEIEGLGSDGSVEFLGLNIELTEFMIVYTRTTALRTLLDSKIKTGLSDAVLVAFDKLNKISSRTEPTFTFSHITVPHPPFLFDENGPIDSQSLEIIGDVYADKEHFLAQMKFVNKKTLETLDAILQNSKEPPIIVLASDHGSTTELGHPYLWKSPDGENTNGIKERMGILNTYYFPDKDYSNLYPTISPVNSFRLILNQYFNGEYELLPDKSYYSNYDKLYKFYDVTETVRH